MSKRSRNDKPTFDDLLAQRDMRAEDLAAAASVSASTVYRAKRGEGLSRLALSAISIAMDLEPDDVIAAIERSTPAKKRRAS